MASGARQQRPRLAAAVSGGVHVAHAGLWGAADTWDVYYRGPVAAEVAAGGVYLPVILKK